ncbi:MAG TPA: DUF4332 domain-containing protein [Vicinamibacteria bacterium]|nr:DUF4332 domain-containing protein [Vicinamibacteria bacterium]
MSLALPALLFVAATLGMALLVEPFLAWYYQWAWWSYILAADGLNRRLGGRSLLRDEPRRFLWLAGISVALWTFFEALNLRLGNWYYVMDHPLRPVRWAGGVVAFATVLPALYETEALLRHLGVLHRVPVALLRWSRPKALGSLTLGVACFALPLVWPNRFFPLTWASFVFLLEPWNRRHAPDSRLRELEQGEAAPTLRWLLAGLACGALWEACNYWARVKWVYTVPGFESLKVFEMPLAGFLGFPPFALECAAIVGFLEGIGERVRGLPRRRLVSASAAALTGAATLAIYAAADGVTVDSYYVPVARLGVLPAPDREALARAGLETPERLLRELGHDTGLEEWSARTGLGVEALRRHRERVALVLHRGLGDERAQELARLGIETREDLAGWRPGELAAALREGGAHGPRRFLERRVRAWLSHATPRGMAGDRARSGTVRCVMPLACASQASST